jgi:eukaryotic-like serine/threonine-protein kinase
MAACPDDRTPSSPRAEPEAEVPSVSVQRAVSRSDSLRSYGSSPAHSSVQHQADAGGEASLDHDRFVPRGVIGRGTSVVIRALDRDLLRDVAIKILNPDLAEPSETDRFIQEARINGQLEHPNIVPVYEHGIDRQGRPFLCMKLVQGETLEDALTRLGEARLEPVHLAKFLQVFLKVCDAVSFAHSRDVVHRDLKPANVMISDFGQVYVLDWGIARLRASSAGREGPRVRLNANPDAESELDPPGSLFGTACYMAPEQLHGSHEKVDQRTDVFALGATLYQILSGQPPLTPEIVRTIWVRRQAPAITAPEHVVGRGRVPPELSRIALRALAYDPADRYASVLELQQDIESFQRGAWDLPRVRVPAGSMIVTEGHAADAAYVIVEGECVAFRVEESAEIELRIMGPGDVFGEAAIFSDKPRTASVKSVTDALLIVVTPHVLTNAVGLNSWVGGFVKALADRFCELDEKLRAVLRTARISNPGGPPPTPPVSTLPTPRS